MEIIKIAFGMGIGLVLAAALYAVLFRVWMHISDAVMRFFAELWRVIREMLGGRRSKHK